MTSSEVVLGIAVFLASAVEMVEALTVVLAVGVTRGWRSSLEGVFVALLVLAALVLAFGPALVQFVPLNLLRSIVGGVLLIFGLQWMRKAVLRASGLKDKRDEDLVYAKTIAQLSAGSKFKNRDMSGFTVAFKGVFIEGLEVIIIVLTLGSSAHDLGLAILAALIAFALVAAVGVIVSRQLSGVPENAMKLMVGLMLVSFGTFWGGEGLGLRWPGSDLMIPALVALYGFVTFLLIRRLTRLAVARNAIESGRDLASLKQHFHDKEEVLVRTVKKAMPLRLARGFLMFWWEFFIGDTPEVFGGTLVIFGVIEFWRHWRFPNVSIVVIAPVLVILLLNATIVRACRSELAGG
ncbi:MAG: hypothetical protein M0Z96_09295 [Actinomycetota bacterium]|nr:hypothetical protein [Actinomycetota bacterium]